MVVTVRNGLTAKQRLWLILLQDQGFPGAIRKSFPKTRQQRCWVHKTANILNKMPKSVQAKAKKDLQEIWMAPTRKDAHQAFDHFVEKYEAKYDKAVACLTKDRDELLAFYDFPGRVARRDFTCRPSQNRT